MKIVAVSDTHMPRMAKALPPALVQELADADLILHAGDWTSPEVYDMLAVYAPVQGVAGNNDGPDIVERWGYRRIVEIGGHRFGLAHGHLGWGSAAQNAYAAFEEEEGISAIVFGHSHVPLLTAANGVTLFNPGSATDKRRQERFSYGIITLQSVMSTYQHGYYSSKV
ncbi:metallophosphoesterase [Saccharibacillus sp. CPCC 101409]|uniref:metallophosphoesterase family protein n=1 Tax=Saccharibacillus sp. CPCC 101409 TaxID=3058041 RepID=UPI0026730F82|nr:metallophosphoesterase [Saccharibacillus sp. CPCC 101409]MDO3412280.1 metallophosphoesterase [Saccharibacillus sp. CPCC 101409]